MSTHFHDLPRLPKVAALAPRLRVAHLRTDAGEGGEIVYDRRLRDGPGSSEYGLAIMRAMSMPRAFLVAAEANRRDLGASGGAPIPDARGSPHAPNPDARGSPDAAADAASAAAAAADGTARARRSRYNRRVGMAACEECGARAASETHHLVPRSEPSAAGASDRYKNRAGNLAALCGECHDRLHRGAEAKGAEAKRAQAKGAALPRRRALTTRGLALVAPAG